tara:strand:- start:9728 stop:10069 length:342 start_codon:yes stop_codon:yes gene_type:complete
MNQTINKVLSILDKYRFIYQSEKELQNHIEKKLKENNIKYSREYRLSDKDIVDFYIDNIAFEVKIKGSTNSIYRQLKRYAEKDNVKAIVLITAKSMGLPKEIEGKKSYYYKLR